MSWPMWCPDDDAVPEVVEKLLDRDGLVDAAQALIACHAMDGHGFSVAIDLDQRVEGVLDDDFGSSARRRRRW